MRQKPSNVTKRTRRVGRSKGAVGAGFSEDGRTFESVPAPAGPDAATVAPTVAHVEIGAGGRVVIPAAMRAALGMKVGDRVTIRLDNDQLSVVTQMALVRRIQDWVRRHDPDDRHGVEQLLAERRREAQQEPKARDD
jgi:AbrB family looped-hinge helix DNA binding protein